MIIQRKTPTPNALAIDRARSVSSVSLERPEPVRAALVFEPQEPSIQAPSRIVQTPSRIVQTLEYTPEQVVRRDYGPGGLYEESVSVRLELPGRRSLPTPPEPFDSDAPTRVSDPLEVSYETRESDTPLGLVAITRPSGFKESSASAPFFELIGSLHKPVASEPALWEELKPGRFEERLFQSPTLDQVELDSYTIQSASYKHPYIESARHTIETAPADDPVFKQLVQLLTGETPTPYTESVLRDYAGQILDRFQRGAPETTPQMAYSLAHQIARVYDQAPSASWVDEWREFRQRVLDGLVPAPYETFETPLFLLDAAWIDPSAPRGLASSILGATQPRTIQRSESARFLMDLIRSRSEGPSNGVRLARDQAIELAGNRLAQMVEGVASEEARQVPPYVVGLLKSLSDWETQQGVSDPFWTSPDAVNQLALGLAFFTAQSELDPGQTPDLNEAHPRAMLAFTQHARGTDALADAVMWLARHYTKLWHRISQRESFEDADYEPNGKAHAKVVQLARMLAQNPEYIKLLLLIYLDDQANRIIPETHVLAQAQLGLIGETKEPRYNDRPFARAMFEEAFDLEDSLGEKGTASDTDTADADETDSGEPAPPLVRSEINRARIAFLSRYAYRLGVDLSVALFQLAMAHRQGGNAEAIAHAYSVVVAQIHKFNRALSDRAQLELDSSLYRPYEVVVQMIQRGNDMSAVRATPAWSLYEEAAHKDQNGFFEDQVSDSIERQKFLLRQLQTELGYYRSAYGDPYYTGGGLQASRDFTEIVRVTTNAAVLLFDEPVRRRMQSSSEALPPITDEKGVVDLLRARLEHAGALRAIRDDLRELSSEAFEKTVQTELGALIQEIQNARGNGAELLKIFMESQQIDQVFSSAGQPGRLVRAMLVWSLFYTLYQPGFYAVTPGAQDESNVVQLVLEEILGHFLGPEQVETAIPALIEFATQAASHLQFDNQSAAHPIFYGLGQLIAYSPDLALGLLIAPLDKEKRNAVVESMFQVKALTAHALKSISIEQMNRILEQSGRPAITDETEREAAAQSIADEVQRLLSTSLASAPQTFLNLFVEQVGFTLTNLSLDSALAGLLAVTGRLPVKKGGALVAEIAVQMGASFQPIADAIRSNNVVGWAHMSRFTPSHMGYFSNDYDDVGKQVGYGQYMGLAADRTAFNLKNRHAKFLENQIARTLNLYKNQALNDALLIYGAMMEGLLLELGEGPEPAGAGLGAFPTDRLKGPAERRREQIASGLYVGSEAIESLYRMRERDIGEPYAAEKARAFESTYDSIPQIVRVPWVVSGAPTKPQKDHLLLIAKHHREQLRTELPQRFERVVQTTFETLGRSAMPRTIESLAEDIRETTLRLFRELGRKPIDLEELEGMKTDFSWSSRVQGIQDLIDRLINRVEFQRPVLEPLTHPARLRFELPEPDAGSSRRSGFQIVFQKTVPGKEENTTRVETSRLFEEYQASGGGARRGPTLNGVIASAQALGSLAAVAVLSETQDVMAQAHARNYFRKLAERSHRIESEEEGNRPRKVGGLIWRISDHLVTVPREHPFQKGGRVPTSYRRGEKVYYRKPLTPSKRQAVRINPIGADETNRPLHPFLDDQLIGIIETYEPSLFTPEEGEQSVSQSGFEKLLKLFSEQSSNAALWSDLDELLSDPALGEKFEATGVPGSEVAVRALKQLRQETGEGARVLPIFNATGGVSFPIPPHINVHTHVTNDPGVKETDRLGLIVHRVVDLVFPLAIVYRPGEKAFQVVCSTVRMVFDTADRAQAHHTRLKIPLNKWGVSGFFYLREEEGETRLMVSAFPVAQLYNDSKSDLIVLEQTIETAKDEMMRLTYGEGDYASRPIFVSFTSSASLEPGVYDSIARLAQKPDRIRFVVTHASFSIRDQIRGLIEPKTFPSGSIKGGYSQAAGRALTRAVYPAITQELHRLGEGEGGEIGTTFTSNNLETISGIEASRRVRYSIAALEIENVNYGVCFTPSYDQPGAVAKAGRSARIPKSALANSILEHQGQVFARPFRTFAAGSTMLETIQKVSSSMIFYQMLASARGFDWDSMNPHQRRALSLALATTLGGAFQALYSRETFENVQSEFTRELVEFYRAMGYPIDSQQPAPDLLKAFEERLKESGRSLPETLNAGNLLNTMLTVFALYTFVTAIARVARNYMPQGLVVYKNGQPFSLYGEALRAFFYHQIGRLLEIGLREGNYDAYTGVLSKEVVQELAAYLINAFDPDTMAPNALRVQQIDRFYTAQQAHAFAADSNAVALILGASRPATTSDERYPEIYRSQEAVDAVLTFREAYERVFKEKDSGYSRLSEKQKLDLLVQTVLARIGPRDQSPLRSIQDHHIQGWFGEQGVRYLKSFEERLFGSHVPTMPGGGQGDDWLRVTVLLKLLSALVEDERLNTSDEAQLANLISAFDVLYRAAQEIAPFVFQSSHPRLASFAPLPSETGAEADAKSGALAADPRKTLGALLALLPLFEFELKQATFYDSGDAAPPEPGDPAQEPPPPPSGKPAGNAPARPAATPASSPPAEAPVSPPSDEPAAPAQASEPPEEAPQTAEPAPSPEPAADTMEPPAIPVLDHGKAEAFEPSRESLEFIVKMAGQQIKENNLSNADIYYAVVDLIVYNKPDLEPVLSRVRALSKDPISKPKPIYQAAQTPEKGNPYKTWILSGWRLIEVKRKDKAEPEALLLRIPVLSIVAQSQAYSVMNTPFGALLGDTLVLFSLGMQEGDHVESIRSFLETLGLEMLENQGPMLARLGTNQITSINPQTEGSSTAQRSDNEKLQLFYNPEPIRPYGSIKVDGEEVLALLKEAGLRNKLLIGQTAIDVQLLKQEKPPQ